MQPVLSYYTADETRKKKRFPFSFRDDLFRVMPSLKKKFWNYKLYSEAGLEEVFKREALLKAKYYKADIFESCIIENKGEGKFAIRPLPVEAQLSCINGIIATDYDNDGNIDLIIAGNSHSNEVVYGWMDASLGILLKGNGKGDFKVVPPEKSGLFLSSDIKGLASLYDSRGSEIIIAAANSDSLIVLNIEKKTATKIFFAGPLDVYAEIEYKNGHKTKQEFYYGSGYLSQSARVLQISSFVKSVQVSDIRGSKRNIQF